MSTNSLQMDSSALFSLPGKPYPRGVHPTPGGVNFCIFSQPAKKVILLLFRPGESKAFWEAPLHPKTNRTGHLWHVEVEGLFAPVEYGYRIEGPHRPDEGAFSDPSQVLFDPYAPMISGGKQWDDDDDEALPRRSALAFPSFDWQGDQPLRTPWRDTVIYELHVRSFTRHPSSKVDHPGTFTGLGQKIPYLKKLGITAVELLPITEFDESHILFYHPETGEKLTNLWGYNPIHYFCPKAAYSSNSDWEGHLRDFKKMVYQFHQAGIEVYLDMVFNHTGEGKIDEPTSSFRGIDNRTYYLWDEKRKNYLNYTGCGNAVNTNHPVVQDLIIDSLRHWVGEYHIDGFRFDLAGLFFRGEDGQPVDRPPILERISRDPVLAHTKIIAEPWDAAGLFQLGKFPGHGRWREWNEHFRNQARQFVRGDRGVVSSLAMCLTGSPDLYVDDSPLASINHITSHDGFTLCDLVSYNHKHNWLNGEKNRDGTQENYSWNCGVEGPTDDTEVIELRKRQMRNHLALLFLSQGVPMITSGDEFARTQRGNNNPYCQDNEISWIDWTLLEENRDLHRFTQQLIAFRRTHPILQWPEFHVDNLGQKQLLTWHGVELYHPDWSPHSHTLAMWIQGREIADGHRDIYVIFNAYEQILSFALPQPSGGGTWHLAVDTSLPSPEDILLSDENLRPWEKETYSVRPYSTVVLTEPV